MQAKSNYNISVTIKDYKADDDLQSLRIVSSLATGLQIFTIGIIYETNSAIIDDILNKYPIKLSINLRGPQDEQPSFEHIEMELQYVKHNFAVSEGRPQMSNQSYLPDRMMVQIIAVSRKAFKTVTQIVNDVYEGKTCKQIIQDLSSKTQAEMIYDTDDENTEQIEQVVIPPSTFYNAIKYLDDNYGLFKGVSNLGFCQYDNKLYIQNLTKRMTKNQTFTISKLASDSDETGEIISKTTTEKWFFTVGSLQTSYEGSAAITAEGKNVIHIVHPDDKLYDTHKQDLPQLCKDYGANCGQATDISLDPNINDREVYVVNHSGDNNSDVYSKVQFGRKIIGMAQVECGIRDSMYLLNLMKVGEPVKLIPSTLEERQLGGKYLLKSSDISFIKSGQVWATSAHLSLMRTNKYV